MLSSGENLTSVCMRKTESRQTAQWATVEEGGEKNSVGHGDLLVFQEPLRRSLFLDLKAAAAFPHTLLCPLEEKLHGRRARSRSRGSGFCWLKRGEEAAGALPPQGGLEEEAV